MRGKKIKVPFFVGAEIRVSPCNEVDRQLLRFVKMERVVAGLWFI